MKKIIVAFIVFCITVNLFALEEVRGVQTRSVLYEYEEKDGLFDKKTIIHGIDEEWSSTSYNIYEFKGFELKNDNDFTVSIEIQLFENQYVISVLGGNIPMAVVVPEHIIDTKNINLEPGEIYVWKTRILASYYYGGDKDDLRTSSAINQYFIKYKAYKIDNKSPNNNKKY